MKRQTPAPYSDDKEYTYVVAETGKVMAICRVKQFFEWDWEAAFRPAYQLVKETPLYFKDYETGFESDQANILPPRKDA